MVRKILKINLPYDEDPLYVDVDDENKSLKEILQEVVLYLEQQGQFYESQQLKAYINDRNLEIINHQRGNNLQANQTLNQQPIQPQNPQHPNQQPIQPQNPQHPNHWGDQQTNQRSAEQPHSLEADEIEIQFRLKNEKNGKNHRRR